MGVTWRAPAAYWTLSPIHSSRLLQCELNYEMLQRRSNLRGILFMVDSATFSKRARDVAEFLYDVLYESAKKVSVLVACNKQDISLAKSSQVTYC